MGLAERQCVRRHVGKVLHLLAVYLWAVPLLFCLIRYLNVLQLNDEQALGLGIRVNAIRVLLMLGSVVLAGGAIAQVGAMAFVGLIAPHIARLWVRNGFVGRPVWR